MNWIFLALLAPFVYAINVFLDKYLISAKIPDYRSLPIFGVFLAVIVVVFLGITEGAGSLNLGSVLFLVLSGVFTIWGFPLYLEALIKEETSIVIILIQLVPVIVLGLSYFILGEDITSKQLLGFFLLFLSSILISLKKEKSSFKFSRGLIFIILADILWALPYILVKFASAEIDFKHLILYENIGVVLGGAVLFFFVNTIREAFLKTIKKIKKPVLCLIFFNEALFLGAKIIAYLAVTIGPVALVSVLGSTQIFYGIIMGIILTLLLPKIIKEDLSKTSLAKKGVFGILAFLGIVLVS